MSRIQEILAKAERDGTTRQPAASVATAMPIAPVSGSSALDTASYMPPPLAPVATVVVPASPTPAPVANDRRTAAATLHPALVTALAPHSPVAEQYRAIRTRLSHREEHMPLRTMMITSPAAGDGKSITASNLALTMAQEIQSNIVLIDADLRSPSVHALFGVTGSPGLAEVLAGTATLDEALVYLPDLRLTLLPAGQTPQLPTELLGSNAMRRVVDTLRGRFDRLVIDVPAVSPLADVGTLAPLADGVVMVVRAGVTQRPALDEALTAFEPNHVVGIVLNETN